MLTKSMLHYDVNGSPYYGGKPYIINTNNLSAQAENVPAYLHSISITKPGSADWVINIYDALSATGTPIVIAANVQQTYDIYGVFQTGIFITTTGTTAGCAVATFSSLQTG